MNIAIIPARGGSKRIPRKNIKEFCGKPIIAYSIKAALKSNCFDRVIVSTDDHEIAEISQSYGAEIPFIRPKVVSDDFSTTIDVMQHAISELKLDTHNKICCLYATAPFLQIKDLAEAYSLLSDSSLDYVFSATEFSFPIQRALRIKNDGLIDMYQKDHINTRSQDLEKSYHDAGQFYFGHADSFIKGKPFFLDSQSRALLLPSYRVIDIDTEDDWKRAELMFKLLKSDNEA